MNSKNFPHTSECPDIKGRKRKENEGQEKRRREGTKRRVGGMGGEEKGKEYRGKDGGRVGLGGTENVSRGTQ